MDKLLCWNCKSLQPYKVCERIRKRIAYGKEYSYNEKYGVCEICNKEIDVPDLFNENECAFEKLIN